MIRKREREVTTARWEERWEVGGGERHDKFDAALSDRGVARQALGKEVSQEGHSVYHHGHAVGLRE